MSLLYKALNKASESSDKSSDAGHAARGPLTEPFATMAAATERRGNLLRVGSLVGLLVIAGAGLGTMFLAPEVIDVLLGTTYEPPARTVSNRTAVSGEPASRPSVRAAAPNGEAGAGIAAASDPAPTGRADSPSASAAVTRDAALSEPEAMVPEPAEAPVVETPTGPAGLPPADARSAAVEPESAEEPETAENVLISRPIRVTPPPRRPRTVDESGLDAYVQGQIGPPAGGDAAGPVAVERGLSAGGNRAAGAVTVTNEADRLRADYERASVMIRSGDARSALAIYDDLLSTRPRDRVALLGRAAALQRLGRSDDAVEAYEAVLAAYPGDRWALTNLLGLVARQTPEDAIAQLRRVMAANPAVASIPAQIGMAYAQTGDGENAVRYLRRAVSMEPGNPVYAYNLAIILDRMGRPEEAVRYYEQVLLVAGRNGAPATLPLGDIRSRLRYLNTN